MRKISLLLVIILLFTSIPFAWADGGSLSNFSPDREYPEGKFTDVKDTDWFSSFVKKAYTYSLVSGNSDTTYNPNGNVTIAETLAIACNLNKIYFGREIGSADGPWYTAFVNYAQAHGIIRAGDYSNYTVPATRTQFATILANCLPEEAFAPIVEVEDYAIPDVKMTDTNADRIYLLYRAGILSGSDSEGSFRPVSSIRRSEVATIISNIVDVTTRKGTSRKADSIGMTWEEFLAGVNERHKTHTLTQRYDEEILPYLDDFKDTLTYFTDEQAKDLITQKPQKDFVSKQEAIEDVDTLFKLYKAYYGSYGYFGGDTTYLPAKEKVLQEIQNNKSESIDTDWLARTICTNLSFVRDGHAFIGRYHFCRDNNLTAYDYYVKDLHIFRDEKGYFFRQNGKKTYIKSVGNDTDLQNYLHISIDDLGRLSYILLFTDTPDSEKLRIDYLKTETNGTLGSHPIAWTAMKERLYEVDASYQTVALKNNIPYVTIKDQAEDGEAQKIKSVILNIYNTINNQDIVIYDILTNTGYSRQAVMGKSILGQGIEAYKISKLMNQIGKTDVIDEYIAPGNYYIFPIPTSWTANSSIHFILQDDNNFSASEGFLAALTSVENTIFFGSTSGGGQITAEHQFFYLPNSHLCTEAGIALRFVYGTENIDGIGYDPDIWVDPESAVDAIYRLCAYYGLENNASTDRILSSKYYLDYAQASAREQFRTAAPVISNDPAPDEEEPIVTPPTSSKITILRSWIPETTHSGENFGFGDAVKALPVQYDGKTITDYSFTATGTNASCVTKNAKGELVFAGKTAGNTTITVTYNGETATFTWVVTL